MFLLEVVSLGTFLAQAYISYTKFITFTYCINITYTGCKYSKKIYIYIFL